MSGKASQRPIMPRPSMPPTPAPSTDITGKSSAVQFDTSFALPPAAINGARGSISSSSTSHNGSDSSFHPPSPASPVATAKTAPTPRKRANAGGTVITKDDYSLPPPPTRSRKIIQMNPSKEIEPARTQSSGSSAAKATTTPATGGKRKQAGNNTAAGRKIARKTAHSLIERRRRSKMNEEFNVLKDMIPACTGQEMHKLAILQASIEYMRYLESCVAELKSQKGHSRRDSVTPASPQKLRQSRLEQSIPEEDEEDDEDEEEEEEEEEEDDGQDEVMSDAVSPTHVPKPERKSTFQFAPTASPALYASDRSVYSTTASPNIMPGDVRNYSANESPALQPSDPHHYSLASSIRSTVTSPSIQASPAFGGQTPSLSQFQNPFASSSKGSFSGPSGATFALTSPALKPQADREDHEATEALLMLNTDRRSWNGGGRGMSVKDLLSG